MYLDTTVSSEKEGSGEVIAGDAGNAVGLDVGALDHLLAVHGAHHRVGEAGRRVGHRKSRRSATGFSLKENIS